MNIKQDILSRCLLCGHGCGANRLEGEIGKCGAGGEIRASAHLLHFGEEPPISGTRGSGTIFFSHCPLSCVFCQNYQISQQGMGEEISVETLADWMLELEDKGAHNINLVSPTPWVVHVLEALSLAKSRGLSLPVVYNTGGFDSSAALDLLDGTVDVYLPDAKFAGPAEYEGRRSPSRELCGRLFGARNYVEVNRAAIRKMFGQVGHLILDEDGVAEKGLLIRHLVLPERMAGSEYVLEWITSEFGPESWLSIMAQYLPFHRIIAEPDLFPELTRRLTPEEYDLILQRAMVMGFEKVFIQDLSSPDTYTPDFETPEVFQRTV